MLLNNKQTHIKPVAQLKTVKPPAPVLERSASLSQAHDGDWLGFVPSSSPGLVACLVVTPQTKLHVEILRDIALKPSCSRTCAAIPSQIGCVHLGKACNGRWSVSLPRCIGSVAVEVHLHSLTKGVFIDADLASANVLVAPEIV